MPAAASSSPLPTHFTVIAALNAGQPGFASGRQTRIVNMSQLGNALTTLNDPPVKALVVYNSNPAAIAPDQNAIRRGLRRDDLFTVVLEQIQADTADFADIVLPATTFLEHTDLYPSYGHYYLQLARPALPPPGEARSNQQIFRALAARMGFDDPALRETDDDMIRQVLSSGHPHLEGITLEALEKHHFVRLNIPSPFLPFAEGDFGTPSGKCRFTPRLSTTPPIESRHGDPALKARFPLEMISPKGDDNMNSTMASRPENNSRNGRITLHPADAATRGITADDAVRVFNDRGECAVHAAVAATVPEGVVCMRSTRWPEADEPTTTTPIRSPRNASQIKEEDPLQYSCLVQVEKSHDRSRSLTIAAATLFALSLNLACSGKPPAPPFRTMKASPPCKLAHRFRSK